MLRSILTVKLVITLSSVLALAQFRTVTVQNATNNPVPTTIQNSSPIPITVQNDLPLATVVTNVPSVNVNGTVPVTGSVSISNAPTVNVNGTVPVNVGNTVSTSISNTPTVNINGTIPVNVGNTVTTAIASAPTLTVQGAVSATISNTPTVNINGPVGVTVSGNPNVSVSNLPTGVAGPANTAVVFVKNVDNTVALSNLPTGTAGPNDTTAVLVKNLDNPGQQPFQTTLQCNTVQGQNQSCTASFNVPAGKGLIIEYLQSTAVESGPGDASYLTLQTTAGTKSANYYYLPGTRISAASNVLEIGEHEVRIYADPGSAVTLTAFQNTAPPVSITFNMMVSGHLVNIP